MVFVSIPKLIQDINYAPTPNLVAQVAVDWSVDYVGAAAIVLNRGDAAPDVIVPADKAPDQAILNRLRHKDGRYGEVLPQDPAHPNAMVMPLAHGDMTYGVLWQAFPDDIVREKHQDTVLMLAGLVATRIHHLLTLNSDAEMNEVVGTLARQTTRLSAATSVSKVIINYQHKEDVTAMLHAVTELICYRFGYASVQVYLLTEDKQALRLAMAYTHDGPQEIGQVPLLSLGEQSTITWAVTADETVVTNDASPQLHYRKSELVAFEVESHLVVPLRSGTQMIGALAIDCEKRHAFEPPDVEIMQSIAGQLAVGINGARLFNEVRDQARDLTALTEISLLVNATLDIDQLAERVYIAFEGLQSPDVFQFIVFDRMNGVLNLEQYTDGKHERIRRPYAPTSDLISQIIAQETPLSWRNEQERETAGAFFMVEQADYPSFLGVPMMAKDSVMGVMCSFSERRNAFNDSALQVMLTFANSVAVAIDNADLFNYTARRVQELAIINEISHVLGRSLGDGNFWEMVQRQIASLFEGSALFVALKDTENPNLLRFPLVSDTTMTPQQYSPIQVVGLCRAVLENEQVLLFADLPAEQEQVRALGVTPQPEEPGYGARSWLGVPMTNSDGVVSGLIAVFHKSASQYDDQDSSLLMTVAAQLSLSLENARLFHAERERRQIADLLIDVGRTVASSLERDEVLERILEQMQRVVDYDTGTVMLNAPGAAHPGELIVSAARGPLSVPLGTRLRFFDDSLMMDVYRDQRVVIVNDVLETTGWEAFNLSPHIVPAVQTRAWMGVPMMIGEQVIGYIFLDKMEPNSFFQRDADTAFALARQAAIAVENARLFTSEHKRRQVADTLIEVGQAVTSQLERDAVLESILEQMQRVVDYDGATVMLPAPGVEDASEMIVYAMRGDISAHPGMRIYFDEDSLNTQVYQNRQPMRVDDVQFVDNFNGRLGDGTAKEEQTRSWICVPMLMQDRFVGFITVDKFVPNYYTQSDVDTVFALSRQAAIAAENARLFEAEQERRQVANMLIDVGRVVASTLDQDKLMQRILDQLQRVVDYDGASIMISTEETDMRMTNMLVATRGAVGSPPGTLVFFGDEHPIQSIYDRQRVVIIPDVQEHASWHDVTMDGPQELLPVRAWMGVPMLVQDRIIGVITLDSFKHNTYDRQDAETAFALARQAAIAIENAQLHEHQKARAKRLSTLHRIASVVSTRLDTARVMTDAAHLLKDLFVAANCMIALRVKDTPGTVVVAYPSLPAAIPISLDDSATHEELMAERAIATLAATNDDPMADLLTQAGLAQALVLPLISNEVLIGFIGLELREPEQLLNNAEEYQTFTAIANQVAVAIYNAELYEQSLAANQLKNQFLATISHELRTPLNAIIGYTDMLLSGIYGLLNSKQIDRMQRVFDNGNRLLELISDVLDLSKIEAGKFELEIAPLDVSAVVNDAVTSIAPQAEAKSLPLKITIAEDLPAAQADSGRIRQVLTNLLSNAVKFTSGGEVTLRVHTAAVHDGSASEIDIPAALDVSDGKWLVFQVSDTGIGISEEDQRIIFDAFRQVDGSARRQHEGTGLGLAISRQITEMHNGHIWVNSEPGVGSCFMVLLPTLDVPAPKDVTLIESDTGVSVLEPSEQPVLVVIDDDATALQLIQDYLSVHAYRVICTNRPTHGLALVRRHRPAVVLLDVMMPDMEMDGFAALAALKGDENTSDIPVVMLSVVEHKPEAMRLGAAAYIPKPINQMKLLRVIEKFTRDERRV